MTATSTRPDGAAAADAICFEDLHPAAIDFTMRLRFSAQQSGAIGWARRLVRWHLPASIFVVLVLALVLVTVSNGTFAGHVGRSALVALATHRPAGTLSLPLCGDPVFFYLLGMALITPVALVVQVRWIASYVGTNRDHCSPILSDVDRPRLLAATKAANDQFQRIGSWQASIACLLAAAGLTIALHFYLSSVGLYRGIVFLAALGRRTAPWAHPAYLHWWAAWPVHPVATVLLGLTATCFFYFLFKQLLMGGAFLLFAVRSYHARFGVAQNVFINLDGHHGLRKMRHFYLVTYAIAIIHQIGFILLFFLALPVNTVTWVLTIGIVVIPAMVIYYPTALARRGVVEAKERSVERLLNVCITHPHLVARNGQSGAADQSPLPSDQVAWRLTLRELSEISSVVERAWAAPHFPFRLSQVVSGMAIYFLLPAMALIVSALLSKG